MKCIICEEREAGHFIKGTNDGYCAECALDFFGALDLLESAEQRATFLKNELDYINEE